MNRNLMLVLLVFIVIFSLTTVSASDTNNTSIDNSNYDADEQLTVDVVEDAQTYSSLILDNNDESSKDKNIIKTYSENVKSSSNSNSITVNNYEELDEILNYKSLNNTVINIAGNNYVADYSLYVYNSVNTTINFNNIPIEKLDIYIYQSSSITFTNFNGNITSSVINTGNLTIMDSIINNPCIENSGNLTISSSKFHNIKGSYVLSSTEGNLNIKNTSFMNNFNQNGLIYVKNTTTTITNCSFINNTNNNTGIITSLDSFLLIQKSIFNNNNARVAACIFHEGNATLRLIDNKFTNNNAYDAGVLYAVYSKLELTNNIFETNTATRYGGVMCLDMASGYVHINNTNSSYIFNNTFLNNMASKGATIYSRLSRYDMTNNIIVNTKKINEINGKDNILNINSNWWGVNNPDFTTLTNNLLPEDWIIITVTSSNNKVTLTFKLNSNNKRAYLNSKRNPYFTVNNTQTKQAGFKSYWNYILTDKNMKIKLDNQVLTLSNDKLDPVMIFNIVTNPKDIEIKINNNPDVTGTIKILLDNTVIKTLNYNLTSYDYKYEFKDYTIGNHNITIQYGGNSKYNAYNFNHSVDIRDNNVTITITNKTRLEAKDTTNPLPAKYDMRDYNMVSPIKDQVGGTCSLFGVIGALETTLLKFTGETLDISENYYKNMLGYGGLYVFRDPNENLNYFDVRNLFMNGISLVTEDVEPYSLNPFSTEYNTNYISIDVTGWDSRDNITAVKRTIYDYGPVVMVYIDDNEYHLDSTYYMSEYPKSYYYINHVLSVVGWDDNFSKNNFKVTPPGDGAWIVKNSWGNNMGDNGFYYISYYDLTATSIGAFDINTFYQYSNIYGYSAIDSPMVNYYAPDYFVKKVYIADNDELITAINSNNKVIIKINNQEVYLEDEVTDIDSNVRQLKQKIPVKKGDLVEIILYNYDRSVYKVFTNLYYLDSARLARIASGNNWEDGSFSTPIYDKGQTFGSDDQLTWMDTSEDNSLYDIRVYTIPTPHIDTKITITGDKLNISTSIDKQNLTTKVSYKINGVLLKDSNSNIINKTITDKSSTVYQLKNAPKKINLTTIIENNNVKYEQTQIIELINTECIITLNKINQQYVQDNVTISGKLIVNNIGQQSKDITIKINDKTYTTKTDENGDYKYTYKILTASTNVVTVTYKDATNNQTYSNITTFISVKKNTFLTVDKIASDTKVLNSTTIKGTLKSDLAITDAIINIKINNNTYSVKTDKNGAFSYKYTYDTIGINNITVSYSGDTNYIKSNEVSYNVNVTKRDVSINIKPIISTVGEEMVLNATVVDEYGQKVTGGNLVFKLNGITIKTDNSFESSNAAPLKLSVVNGSVVYKIIATKFIRNAKNITASYSGSYNYEASTTKEATQAQITLRNVSVQVKTSVEVVKQNTDIEFIATMTDITTNSKTSMLNDNSYVIFKVNGVTLKDENGKNIQVKVVNNTAKYTFHIASGTGGITKDGKIRNYTVTAVYSSPNYYPSATARDNTTYQIQRSNITLKTESVVIDKNKRTLCIKANIVDYLGDKTLGNSKYCIKINGKTLKDTNGNVIYYNATNGIIDITNVTVPKVKEYTLVTVVIGARKGYYGLSEQIGKFTLI